MVMDFRNLLSGKKSKPKVKPAAKAAPAAARIDRYMDRRAAATALPPQVPQKSAARETIGGVPGGGPTGGASTATLQHSTLIPLSAVAADPAQAAGSSYLPVDQNDRDADPRWGEPAVRWPRLMDDATVDKFLASQEDDEPRVVWRASPQVAHPPRVVPQQGTPALPGAASSAGATPSSSSSDSQGAVAPGSEGSNASLRARLLLAVQSGRSGGGARPAAPRPQDDAFTMQPSRLSNRSAIDEIVSTAPDGLPTGSTSPNPGCRAGNQRRRLSLTAPSGGNVTPLRAVRPPQSQLDTRPSSLRKTGRVDSHARQAGRKRKALLELLDQVENIVHTRGVPSATQKSSLVLAPVSMADQSAVPALMLSPRKDSQPVVLTEIAVLADEELDGSICPSTSESPIPVPARVQHPSSKDSGPISSRYSNTQPIAPHGEIASSAALCSSQPSASNPSSIAQQPLVVDRSTPASVRREKAAVQSSMGIFSQYPALEGLQEDLDDELMQMLAEADRHVALHPNGSQAIPDELPAPALPTVVIVPQAGIKPAERHAIDTSMTGVASNVTLSPPFSRGLFHCTGVIAPQNATASLEQSGGVSVVAKQGSQLARPISAAAAAAPDQIQSKASPTEAVPPIKAATGFALPLQGVELHTNSGVFANMSDEDDDWCDIAEAPAGVAAYPTQPYTNLHVRPEQSVGLSDTAVPAASGFDSHAEAPAGPPGGSLPAPEMPLVGSSTRDELPLAGERRRLHHVVLEVLDGGNSKTLRLLNEYTCVETIAHLHDCWVETPVAVGDSVNLIAQVYSHEGVQHAVLDNDAGLLIIHPDVLLSGTRITSSLQCIRKAALEERYPGSSNAKALEGTLLHDLLQAALAENLRSPEALRAHAEHLVATNTKELLEVGLDEAAAMERLANAIPNMLQWMSTYVADHLQPASLVDMGYSSTGPAAQRMCIQEVTDIEESVWAPKYGIKGNIDATLMVAFETGPRQQQHRQRVQTLGQQPQLSAVLAPFEFKTGKPHMSHRAQVSLYLLLLEERYGSPPDVGLLWYINQQGPMAVKRTNQELAALLMKRNDLAASMVGGRGLPPMIRDASKYGCTKCFSVNACAVAHKALEGGDAESAGMGDAFHRETGHLSAQHSAFLAHWHHLLDLEETGLQEKRSEIWRLHGSERQDGRRCIAGLRMISHAKASEPSSQGDWIYTFCRVTAAAGNSPPPKALNVSGMLAGEMVVLSLEGRHPQVARSVVHAALPDSIQLALHRPLRAGLLQQGQEAGMSWRIDKDESGTLNTRMRGSLMTLAGSNRRSARLRALLVDLQAPRIPDAADDCRSPSISGTGNRWCTSEEAKEEIPDDVPAPEGGAEEIGRNEGSAGLPPSTVEEQVAKPLTGRAALEVIAARLGAQLNGEQRLAVQRVLMGADYNLVLGMPGAGKTTTIVAAVTALAAAGRSVLLTSYTNSAVDNILLKLRKEGVDFLRLGRTSGVHPGVADALPGGTRHPAPTVAAMRQLAATTSVVACTCLSTNSPLLARRTFDVCIVDEASQITLPATLGALLKARTFVLVGDHNQLPPLVTNAAAEAGGLSKSLFRLLSEAHPQAVVALREQFRMNSDIMTLSNTLVYSGQLQCGSQAVADGMLVLPRQLTAEEAPPWLLEVLRPERRVVFLDTDALSAGREESAADAMCNKAEAALLLRVVEALVSGGMLDSAIGAISPYRSQVALLERLAVERGLTGMEALTVDKSQGRDKDCILVSFVRSNEGANAGRLLADWRRINVAITRARHKLVLIGSAKTLASVPLFRHLLELVRQRQWCINLPTDALE